MPGDLQPGHPDRRGEFTAELGGECKLSFENLFAADLAGRGRALKQMVENGVPLTEALDIMGLGGDA